MATKQEVFNAAQQHATAIIGAYVALVKGKGLCPFHSERTPSFFVTDNKGYHCFGCHAGGSVINFIERVEDVNADAYEIVAARLGIEYKKSVRAAPQSLYDLEWQRMSKELPQCAIDYIDNCTLHKDTEVRYDYQRDAIVFRLLNSYGDSCIGLSRRMLNNENTKWHHSLPKDVSGEINYIYNTHRAAKAARKRAELFIVEGITDCEAMTWHFPNTVSCLGSNITLAQAWVIAKMSSKAIIVYDGDTGGNSGAYRSALKLIMMGVEVDIVVLPDKQDPNSMIKVDAASFNSLVSLTRSSIWDVFHKALDTMIRDGDISDYVQSKERIIAAIKANTDPIRRKYFMERFYSKKKYFNTEARLKLNSSQLFELYLFSHLCALWRDFPNDRELITPRLKELGLYDNICKYYSDYAAAELDMQLVSQYI